MSGYNRVGAVIAADPTRVEVAMALPKPEQVKSWGGKLLVDSTGQPIGTITQVYNDDATGLPEWATTRLGEATFVIPLQGAVEAAGHIRVAVHRDDVAKSPAVVDKAHITPDEEARLYQYYGIPYSPERSRSGLPAGEGPLPAWGARARAIATSTGRRFGAEPVRRLRGDPVTLTFGAIAAVLATLLWAMLRRQRAGNGTAS
jgi:hypothetical protein